MTLLGEVSAPSPPFLLPHTWNPGSQAVLGPRPHLHGHRGFGDGAEMARQRWSCAGSVPPQLHVPRVPSGQDQDWSAIAAVQCRLDREGATKLVADLIMNTKNEKIFQESILLAIRLLDGGNTEIQVLGGIGQPGLGVGSVGLRFSALGTRFGQNTSRLC